MEDMVLLRGEIKQRGHAKNQVTASLSLHEYDFFDLQNSGENLKNHSQEKSPSDVHLPSACHDCRV